MPISVIPIQRSCKTRAASPERKESNHKKNTSRGEQTRETERKRKNREKKSFRSVLPAPPRSHRRRTEPICPCRRSKHISPRLHQIHAAVDSTTAMPHQIPSPPCAQANTTPPALMSPEASLQQPSHCRDLAYPVALAQGCAVPIAPSLQPVADITAVPAKRR